MFFVKNTHNLRICWIKKIDNVLRNIPVNVDKILFNSDVQKIPFNSAEKMAEKMVPKQDLDNGEKHF